MQSTTLMFSSAERRKDPMCFVERAWPQPFEFSRRAFPRPQRWLYSWRVRWLKSRLPGPHPTERRTVVQAIRIVAYWRAPLEVDRFAFLASRQGLLSRRPTSRTTENAPPGRRGASGVTTGRRDMYLYICGSVGGR